MSLLALKQGALHDFVDQRFESIILVAEATDDDFDLRLVRLRGCCAGTISEQFFGEVASELVFDFKDECLVFVNVAKRRGERTGYAFDRERLPIAVLGMFGTRNCGYHPI